MARRWWNGFLHMSRLGIKWMHAYERGVLGYGLPRLNFGKRTSFFGRYYYIGVVDDLLGREECNSSLFHSPLDCSTQTIASLSRCLVLLFYLNLTSLLPHYFNFLVHLITNVLTSASHRIVIRQLPPIPLCSTCLPSFEVQNYPFFATICSRLVKFTLRTFPLFGRPSLSF